MNQASYSARINRPSLIKRVLIGAAIGLLVISYFLFTLKGDHPYWGELWMIRPLIVLPFAGAVGGLCNYFIMLFHKSLGVNKVTAIVLSGMVFIVGIWLGIVLGLHGTMWN